MSKRSYSDVPRIYYDLDNREAVFQNRTLTGPVLNEDGSKADQDEIRAKLHEEMERKVCHIYRGKKYCACVRDGHEKECCVSWSEAVLKQIEEAEKAGRILNGKWSFWKE